MAIFEYYSITTGAVASDTVTVNAGSTHRYSGQMFGLFGVITSTPYDTSGGLPYKNSGANTVPTVTGITTVNPTDIIIAIEGQTGSTAQGVGSIGGTAATSVNFFTANTLQANAELVSVSSIQSGISATFSSAPGSGNTWIMMVDAIDPPSPSGAPAAGTAQGPASDGLGSIIPLLGFGLSAPLTEQTCRSNPGGFKVRERSPRRALAGRSLPFRGISPVETMALTP
jgi:hypothetical protein